MVAPRVLGVPKSPSIISFVGRTGASGGKVGRSGRAVAAGGIVAPPGCWPGGAIGTSVSCGRGTSVGVVGVVGAVNGSRPGVDVGVAMPGMSVGVARGGGAVLTNSRSTQPTAPVES